MMYCTTYSSTFLWPDSSRNRTQAGTREHLKSSPRTTSLLRSYSHLGLGSSSSSYYSYTVHQMRWALLHCPNCQSVRKQSKSPPETSTNHPPSIHPSIHLVAVAGEASAGSLTSTRTLSGRILRTRTRQGAIMPIMWNKIRFNVDINIWFKYSDTDMVSDVEYSNSNMNRSKHL